MHSRHQKSYQGTQGIQELPPTGSMPSHGPSLGLTGSGNPHGPSWTPKWTLKWTLQGRLLGTLDDKRPSRVPPGSKLINFLDRPLENGHIVVYLQTLTSQLFSHCATVTWNFICKISDPAGNPVLIH